MPYSVSNPPKKLHKLSDRKQRQWVHVFNQSKGQGDDEGTAHAKAWGVVKKSSCSGQTICPTESEGSIYDATRVQDLLSASSNLVLAAKLMYPINRRIAFTIIDIVDTLKV